MQLENFIAPINRFSINCSEQGRKLSDVSHILELMNDIIQNVAVNRYIQLLNRSAQAIAVIIFNFYVC